MSLLHKMPLKVKTLSIGMTNTGPVFTWYRIELAVLHSTSEHGLTKPPAAPAYYANLSIRTTLYWQIITFPKHQLGDTKEFHEFG